MMTMVMSVPGRPVPRMTMFVSVITDSVANRRADDKCHGFVILVCLHRERQAQTQGYDTDSNPLHILSVHFCLLSISGRVRMGATP
jgi:hypothetical protein